MIEPKTVAFFFPPGLKKFKLDLFNRIANKIVQAGGLAIREDYKALADLPDHILPITGASPELWLLHQQWFARKRNWIYWDRGYARRIFATWLPRGDKGGYYRYHLNAYQMQRIRDVPDDRWRALLPGNLADRRNLEVHSWCNGGRHIVVATPSPTYVKSHGIPNWTEKTIAQLKTLTDRPIVVRDKESKKSLQEDVHGAHCLVSHGSNAAVEAVIMGCPVFVHPDSAAALVGLTDLTKIENPIYPDRDRWLHSLAYCQFNETELVDGTLWRLME